MEAGRSSPNRLITNARGSILVAGVAAMAILQPCPASGETCLHVQNVEFWDFLNIREKPSASASIVGAIAPRHSAPLELTGACIPATVRSTARWCPVIYYVTGQIRLKGYVKAYFTRPVPCPPSLATYKNQPK
jgi:hypothetical protein